METQHTPEPLGEAQSQDKRRSWLMWAAIAIVFVLMIAGIWMYIAMQSESSTSGENTSTSQEDTDQQQEDGDTDAPTEELFAGEGIHITVHVEPVDTTPQALQRWQKIQSMIDLSDEYDMKLSLHFSPSMAEFVLEDEARLAELRHMEASGHEIGFHHHGLEHLIWDGYSNDPAAADMEGYKGDMEDFLDLISQLSADGEILVGSGTDEETDWPQGVVFGTTGSSPPSIIDMVSELEVQNLNGTDVAVLHKAGFGVEHLDENVTYADLRRVMGSIEEGKYIGLTLTDITFDSEDEEELERVYELFVGYNVHVQTVAELLQPHMISSK